MATLLAVIKAEDGPPPVRRPGKNGPPQVQVKYIAPGDSVIAAALDCATINQESRCTTRYLSLYNVPVNDRIKTVQTINFLINSISRARNIKHVYVVPGTDNTLLRLDMSDYQFYSDSTKTYTGWNPKVWDKLGERDIYFTSVKIKVDQEIIIEKVKKTREVPSGRKVYYRADNGQYYLKDEIITETYYEEVSKPGDKKETKIRDAAGWIDQKAFTDLQAMTQSKYPILRADFFNATASLPPFYHDFLEFGDKANDFLEAVGVDQKIIEKLNVEYKGVVVKSGAGMVGKVIPVSENNRFIQRFPSVYGYVWRTKDVKIVKDINDYLRTLDDGAFDASEWIATGRNGLQWYFLSDNQGNRQDEAPIDIVKDDTNNDRRVRNGRSCITCHFRGINEFKALPQEMVKHAIDVISPDYKKSKQLRESFIGNLDEFFADDNKVYFRAVSSATTVHVGGEVFSLNTEINANQFGAIYNSYAVDAIDLRMASYECGVPIKNLMVIFAAAKNDPYLLGLSRNEPLFAVPRVHWERSYQQAMLLVTEWKGAYK